MPPAFWSEARAQMLLDPTVINLNTGSFGPLPRPVFERATELRHQLAEESVAREVRVRGRVKGVSPGCRLLDGDQVVCSNVTCVSAAAVAPLSPAVRRVLPDP